MNIKEITSLRKSGRLQEALEAAESEFAANKNKYTVGALFWCLNDLYKTQEQNESRETVERMKALYEEYGGGDELMHKAMLNADKRSLPYSQEISKSLTMAKEGVHIYGIISTIVDIHQSSELDSSLFNDFGWLIYYTLKHTTPNDTHYRKLLLSYYLKLDLPRPSILHSRILSEAIRLEQQSPLQFRFRDFIRLWGVENLMEDDWNQFKPEDGKTLPSLVEKLIGVYAKEVKTDGIEAADEFSSLVDKALERYPTHQNMPYFKAIVLISQGNKEEAIQHYKQLILKFPSKFYLWSQLAELVEDNEIKVGLLCKALTCGEDDNFLGGVRLRLANLLLEKHLFSNASYELNKYKEVYLSQGWHLKPEYWDLENRISDCERLETNQPLYDSYTVMADTFIYEGLPSMIAIKISHKLIDDRHHPGKRFIQWVLQTNTGILRLKKTNKFGLEKSRNGAIFEVKVYNKKIVWIKPSQEDPLHLDWVKKMEGTIKMRRDKNGKKYAILNGAYIEERLLRNLEGEPKVKIVAFRQTDGRWTAISLIKR